MAYDFGLFGETAGLCSNLSTRNKSAALPPFTSFPEPPGPAAPRPSMVGAALLAFHAVTYFLCVCVVLLVELNPNLSVFGGWQTAALMS